MLAQDKVYVVMWNYSEGGYNSASGILHIFKTKDKAEEYVKESNKLKNLEDYDCPDTIQEWDVLG